MGKSLLAPVRIGAVFLASLAFPSCQWPGGGEERSCADHARLELPVDLQAFAAKGILWPYGVHGGGNPEGHPGMDFLLEGGGADLEIPVLASFSAEIVAITAEEDLPGASCVILDSACVQVNLCHLRLDPGLGLGSRVTRGQRLGQVAAMGKPGNYSLHFGTYLEMGDEPVCPADLLDQDTVRCRLGAGVGEPAPEGCGAASGRETLLGRSSYVETSAREINVTCADGSTRTFAVPAEARICNNRLPAAMRRRMEDCLGPTCQGVW